MHNQIRTSWGRVTVTALLLSAPLGALEFGNINVIQLNGGNDGYEGADPSVSVSIDSGATADLMIRGGNRGDFELDFGGGGDDGYEGVLISSVRQNSRNNFADGDSVDGLNYATSGATLSGAGYYVPVHNMGGSAENTGGRSEFNINLAVGLFPYDDFLGGQTVSVTDLSLISSPGIAVDQEVTEIANGVFGVDLTSLEIPYTSGTSASADNGVLLTVSAQNEGNFTMGQDNEDGSFTVSVMDNGTFGGGVDYENDLFSFVYVPTSAAGSGLVTAVGRIQGDGSAEISGGSFAVTPRRSATSLGSVLASGSFESELTDDEALYSAVIPDVSSDTYLLEITSGPDVGTFVEVSTISSDTTLAIAEALSAVEADYPVDYRLGTAGFEYLLEIPNKNPQNGTLLVTPEGGQGEVTEVEVMTGAFESGLTDDEGAFLSNLSAAQAADGEYLLEVTSGPDTGSLFDVTGVLSNTELTLSAALTAAVEDYPVSYRIISNQLADNTDNFVTYEWDATAGSAGGWIVQSRDVPRGFVTENGASTDEDIFSFAFLTSAPANSQPVVSLDSPLDGSSLVQNSTFTLSATASDVSSGSVVGVEFFLNGVSQGTDSSAPYQLSNVGPLVTLENVQVDATVVDNEGARAKAEPVSFSVVPPAGSDGLYFNGIDQYVTFGDEAAFKLSTFTLETWFKPEGNFGQAAGTGAGGVTAFPLITKGRGESDQSTADANFFLGIRESDGVLVADFEDLTSGANIPVSGHTVVSSGVWQHAAVTFDGSSWNLYLNGNLEATLDAGGLVPRFDSIQHAALASAQNTLGEASGFFQGFLDEPRIWDRALTQEEIWEKSNFEITVESGLVGRFAMTEGAGATLTSTAAGAVSGTLVNAPTWSAGADFSNNAKPQIVLLEPISSSYLPQGSTTSVSVSASDTDGSVAQVEFFDNGASIAVVTTAPYRYDYVGTEPGGHTISVVVTDEAGESSSVFFTVQVVLPAPTLPGYTVGVYDGGSLDIDTPDYVPAANDTFTWLVESTTTSPAFGAGGGNRGDLAPTINESLIPYASGLILGTNHPTLDNLASLDNNIALESSGSGNYYLSVEDNEGPGADNPSTPEESGRLSTGFFPWADGWFGAQVFSDTTIRGGSFNYPTGANVTITKPEDTAGVYEIKGFPTVGNLLAITCDNGSDNLTSVSLEGDTWVVNSYDNGGGLQDGDFAFLYVPVSTPQVMSGLVENDGTLVPLNTELDMVGATVNLGAQGYEVTIGDGSVINPSNSVMFVTGDFGNGEGGDNIYSYFANGDAFVVFSQDAPFLTSQFEQGGFRFLVVPQDPVTLTGEEVVVVATDAEATEGGDPGTFTFTRFGDVSAALTVSITASGSAESGVDYTTLPNVVTFPAGSSTTTLPLSALTDGRLELAESVVVTLLGGTGYTVGSYASATVSIVNVNPTVTTTTVTFQEGVDGYTGQFGLRVGEGDLRQLGADYQSYYMDGMPGSGSDQNGIIRFDNIFGPGEGQIPLGAGIQDAQLIITTSNATNADSGGPFIVDQLTRAVTEETTYLDLQYGATGEGFEGVRGAGTGFPVAGFGVASHGDVIAANVTQLVQNWSTGTVSPTQGYDNEGFSIYSGGTTNGWSYNTVGNDNPTLRPKLQVTYTTDTTLKDYFFEADLNSIINNSQGDGNTTSAALDGSTIVTQYLDLNDPTSGTTEALLRFPVSFGDLNDLNSIPAGETVIKAELLMTTNGPSLSGTSNSQGSGPYGVHQMLVDWDTETTFGLTGPVVNSEIAEAATHLIGMGQLSTTYGDITSIIQNWRAGAPNYGINLKPETGDGWQPFWLGAADEPGFGQAAPFLRVTTAILESTGYDDYMAANGAAGANFLDDRDGDGVVGLLEYALGLDPTSFDSLPGLVRESGDFRLTYGKGALGGADSRLSYVIETSSDLVTWTPVTAEVNDASEISALIPGPDSASESMLFTRIQVDYN